MGRAPCCEKVGLKKGPWSAEEDKILLTFVQNHGHGNWRALPKQAGLPRCGKSCRLRWMNYLRPDIKRGSFSEEEEDTVIKLHQMLGNKWSAIAASLPGRTDNEIKNVWHTHLKKRVERQQSNLKPTVLKKKSKPGKLQTEVSAEVSSSSSSEVSSATDDPASMSEREFNVNAGAVGGCFVDERSWSETPLGFINVTGDDLQFDDLVESALDYDPPTPDDDYMDFWYNIFVRAGGKHEL